MKLSVRPKRPCAECRVRRASKSAGHRKRAQTATWHANDSKAALRVKPAQTERGKTAQPGSHRTPLRSLAEASLICAPSARLQLHLKVTLVHGRPPRVDQQPLECTRSQAGASRRSPGTEAMPSCARRSSWSAFRSVHALGAEARACSKQRKIWRQDHGREGRIPWAIN